MKFKHSYKLMLLAVLATSAVTSSAFADDKDKNKNIFEKAVQNVEDMLQAVGIPVGGDNCNAAAGEEPKEEDLYPSYYKYKPLKCKKSKAPILTLDRNALPEINITADFEKINKTKGNSSPSVLSYRDKNGKMQHIVAETSSRGNSRGSNCEWKPLRVRYYDQSIIGKTQKNNPGVNVGSEKFMAQLYTDMKNNPANLKTGDNTLEGGLFDKTGDDIKIVTHCGKSSQWEMVGGATPEEQDRVLLEEYYLYQMIGKMKSTVLDVQLVNINYRDPNGKIITTRKGLIRESSGKLAKRCKLEKENNGNGSFNQVSKMQADLYSAFLYNYDYSLYGHNTEIVYNKDGEKHVVLYDFDLSGLVRPDYHKFKYKGYNYLNTVLSNLENENKEIAVVQVNELIRKLDNMKKVVDDSLLTQESKDKFYALLKNQGNILTEYMKNYQSTNPEKYTELIPEDKRVLEFAPTKDKDKDVPEQVKAFREEFNHR